MASQPYRPPSIGVGCNLIRYDHQAAPVIESQQDILSGVAAARVKSKLEVTKTQEQFFMAIEKLKQEHKDPDLKEFDIRSNQGWRSVFAVSDVALQQYDNKHKGFGGLLRRLGNMIGRADATLKPLTEMIPSGDYTSIASGGTKFILAMCKRKLEQETMVREVLADALEYLQDAETCMGLYPFNEDIGNRVDTLYIEVLRAIMGLADWLTSLRIRTRSQIGTDRVQPHRTAIDSAMKRLKQCVVRCDQTLQVHSHFMLEQVSKNVARLSIENDVRAEQILALIRDNEKMKTTYIEVQNERQREVHEQHEDQKKLQDELRSLKQLTLNSLAAGQQLFDWMSENRKLIQESYVQETKAQVSDTTYSLESPSPVRSTLVRPLAMAQLLQWLATDPDTASDLELHRQWEGIPTLGSKMSISLAQSYHFIRWLDPNYSRILLVDPVGGLAERGRSPSSSFVVASLAGTVSKQKYALVLTHFCAQHRYQTRFDLVASVLASLISQLLRLYPFDSTTWASTYGYTEALHKRMAEERDLLYLCRLFEDMVHFIVLRTVFVFVDDLWCLEQAAEDRSLNLFAETLMRLIESTRNLKILFMTPEAGCRGQISEQISTNMTIKIDLDELDRVAERQYLEEEPAHHDGPTPMSVFLGD